MLVKVSISQILLLNSKDRDAELEVGPRYGRSYSAIKRPVSIRANGEGLGIAFGFAAVKHGIIYSQCNGTKRVGEDFKAGLKVQINKNVPVVEGFVLTCNVPQ